jgi:hypothetical protein
LGSRNLRVRLALNALQGSLASCSITAVWLIVLVRRVEVRGCLSLSRSSLTVQLLQSPPDPSTCHPADSSAQFLPSSSWSPRPVAGGASATSPLPLHRIRPRGILLPLPFLLLLPSLRFALSFSSLMLARGLGSRGSWPTCGSPRRKNGS